MSLICLPHELRETVKGPKNGASVLYVLIQDHPLEGSPGHCLATQYR